MSQMQSQTNMMENEITDFEVLDFYNGYEEDENIDMLTFFNDLFEEIEEEKNVDYDLEEKNVENKEIKEIIRKQKVEKYLKKKKRRCYKSKILYKQRKSFAETRPRFKGRFLPIATDEFVSVKDLKRMHKEKI